MTVLLLLALSGARAQEACLEPPCSTTVELTPVETLDETLDEEEVDRYALMADDIRSPYWYEPATDTLFWLARGAVGEAHVAEAALLGLAAVLHHSAKFVWLYALAPVVLFVRRRLGVLKQEEEATLTSSARMLISKAVERQMATASAEQHKQINLLKTQLHVAQQTLAQRDRELVARIKATQALRDTLERVLGTACNAAGQPLDEPPS